MLIYVCVCVCVCVCRASPIILINNRDVTKVSTEDCNAEKDISKEVNART